MTDKGMQKCFCGAALVIAQEGNLATVEHVEGGFVKTQVFDVDERMQHAITTWLIDSHPTNKRN